MSESSGNTPEEYSSSPDNINNSNGNSNSNNAGTGGLLGLFSPLSASSSRAQENSSCDSNSDHHHQQQQQQRPKLATVTDDSFRVVGTPTVKEEEDSGDDFPLPNENAGSLTHLTNLFQGQSGGTLPDQEYAAAAATADDDYEAPWHRKNAEAPWHRKNASVDYYNEQMPSNHPLQRRSTKKGSNRSNERTTLLQDTLNDDFADYDTSNAESKHSAGLSGSSHHSNAFYDMKYSPGFQSAKTPQSGPGERKNASPKGAYTKVPDTSERPLQEYSKGCDFNATVKHMGDMMLQGVTTPTTWIGAFMFVLYHIVFTLAAGSAIRRPHATGSILGLMTKSASLGIIFAGPVYLFIIGNDIPSMYPTCDLFLAPILANVAKIIDQTLAEDTSISEEENDSVFLATFAFLAFVGVGLAGLLIISAGIFRLANLAAFLPFPVLCGFFSAVGILTWHLGFVVDTSGKTFHAVFFSGDTSLMLYALMHHVPGVVVAVIMKYLGPKNPFYVVAVLFSTVAMVYVVLFATGTTLDEARAMGWFWYHKDIVYQKMDSTIGFKQWSPPAPFGMWNTLIRGEVHWGAVSNGFQTTCAMGFLYLIRCALHSAALLRNVPNLARKIKVDAPPQSAPKANPRKKSRIEKFSEMVDIEEVMLGIGNRTDAKNSSTEVEKAKQSSWSLQGIMIMYGTVQTVSAVVGGFGTIPSVATSHAMYSLKAEKVGPQLGSVILLLVFYLTDFRLIAYVPKMAFSCLLDLAFIDMILTWFIRSYFKTKDKAEWLVCPLIVLFSFSFNLLAGVFMGIACSTFLFVAALFRSGVVKFAASGLMVRSTIERGTTSAEWLDENGDCIQILVLTNYLFFGNANSILTYVSSMFEEPEYIKNKDGEASLTLPPLPKFVILDMALVTGIDTSTVDVIKDILNLCVNHNCKLFLSGMSANLRSVLAHAGVKPLSGERSERMMRFFNSLDTALGKAEDMLLEVPLQEKPQSIRKLLSLGEDSGFQLALNCIDAQHGTTFAKDLAGLEDYTTPIELEPNESLYDSPSRPERGLFFIEKGVMKIERDADLTANTRGLTNRSVLSRAGHFVGGGSISGLKARTGSVGREVSRMKAFKRGQTQQTFRLARVGAGWVVGAIEAVSGMQNAGIHLAVNRCRVHYLSYSQMEALETKDPVLMLHLYKLLSTMLAKQQELTTGQLATFHSIVSSPSQKKPIGRKAALAFRGS